MPAELTALDWVLVGVVAVLALVGLVRGLSGELGSLAGFVAALAAGFLLYGAAEGCAATFGFTARGMGTPAAGAIDFVFALVAFGLARWIVSRFVSCCLGRVADAALGLFGGVFKGVVVVGLLTGIGIVRSGTYAEGFFASHSMIVRTIAVWADAYASGAER